MTDTDGDRVDLERLFAAARTQAGDLPPGLEARILADAARVRAGRSRPAPLSPAARLRRIWDVLGGWPAAAGLATACAAGIWIGLAPPAFLPDPVALVTGAEAGFDALDSDPFYTLLEDDA